MIAKRLKRRSEGGFAEVTTVGASLAEAYSHSTVPGGFEVISYVTRLMPATSFVMREEM